MDSSPLPSLSSNYRQHNYLIMSDKKTSVEAVITEVDSSPAYEAGSIKSENKRNFVQNWFDGFKPYEMEELDPNLSEVEKAAIATANAPLQRKLKNRHLQMIAIGGSIGTGLFVGSGKALAAAGPAALLIAWGLTGIMIYFTVQALGELSVTMPVSGSFAVYSTRFIDPSWGCAMGFNYAMQWLIVLPLELVAASITLSYWEGSKSVNADVWVLIFYLLIVVINLFGVKGYGEAEFVFSLIKVITVIAFIFMGIILNCGGGPKGEYIGGRYWKNPGAFNTEYNPFKAVCSVFVTSAFSFAGTELVGLAAAEATNPRKSLPTAIKQVFWRIMLFYIISLTLIGLLVPFNDPRLIGSSSVDASASPFVIAIVSNGIHGLDSVMNVVIMIAVLSVGNSAVYGSSRILQSLAAQGQAPKILGYIDREGRPLAAIGLTLLFGCLAFVAASPKQGEMFDWLLALSGLSSIFTWGSICLSHIRFRACLKSLGRGTNELVFTAQGGIIGSWIGLIINCLVLIVSFWVAAFPLGDKSSAEGFFKAYLTVPVVIIVYVIHKIVKKNWCLYVKLNEMDVDSGRRDFDLELLKQEIVEEKETLARKPFWYRTYKFWC